MSPDPDLEAFCAFYNKLDKSCTKNLYKIYTPDIAFADPLHRIDGLPALEAYFASLYENVTACRFVFHDRQRQGDTAFVTWTMHLAHRRLDGGREITVEGASRLLFAGDDTGRVREHRDYFDAGALLYERVPLLGTAIRWLKRRAGG
ncbi:MULTISPECIES: nuclear transport factor 2 family protein [unclassified Halomonas]|uniref:nuclear transport factor 2 family protein n=1 Tax=unclassified Halomonas TaxID=2609666 RepID=UPI00061492A2|nr:MULTISPECIES: nuclear transport factor 2 family protein [unclassified Halomonas]RAH36879.1 nuclear transport factor 2 family protein [Halomonas sp. SL1]